MAKRAEDYRRDGETKEQCFARYMQTDEGRRAYSVFRALPNPAPERRWSPRRAGCTVAELRSPTEARRRALQSRATELPDGRCRLCQGLRHRKHRVLVAAERSENRPGIRAVEKGDGGSAPIGDRVAALASSLARTHRDLSHADAIKSPNRDKSNHATNRLTAALPGVS